MELVILAAGMGSRFGGLKQIEPIDEFNNFIIDYSIYDAIEAGFDRVVIIINRAMYDTFVDTIGRRISDKIKVEYVFQEMDDLACQIKKVDRKKPWGTAHALYAARNAIKDDFVIINSDDYYGKESYKIAYDYLLGINHKEEGKYANVAFRAKNTLTDNGAVKRGVCFTDSKNELIQLIESSIEKKEDSIIATPLDSNMSKMCIQENTLVSMNMFVFTKDILGHLKHEFEAFLKDDNVDLSKDEFLLPDVVSKLIEKRIATVKVLETPSIWYGVTYLQDKVKVVESIKCQVDLGNYKKGLW